MMKVNHYQWPESASVAVIVPGKVSALRNYIMASCPKTSCSIADDCAAAVASA